MFGVSGQVSGGAFKLSRLADDLAGFDGSAAGLAVLSKAVLAEIELGVEGGNECSAVYRAHRVALRNWLGKYRSLERVAVSDRVRGFDEAYHHLREMGALEQALGVKRVTLRVRKRLARSRWEAFEQVYKGRNE